MTKVMESGEGGLEKSTRFFRNINVVGALALGGAGVALESGLLLTLSAVNAAQAGFFEMTRRWAKKRVAAKAGRLAMAGS